MDILEIILICVCSLLALGFVLVRVFKGGIAGLLMKTFASFGFVSSGVIGIVISDLSGNYKWAAGLIVIGLLLGMIGDIVLDLKVIYEGNDKYFLNAGMLSFFVGHICYISAFSVWVNPIQRFTSALSIPVALLISAGIAILLTVGTLLSGKKMMGLSFGKFIYQTIAYTFILNMSMAYLLVLSLFVANLWLAFVGLVLFLLSDIVLSLQYFGGKLSNKPLIAINHILYYAAQIIILAVAFML